MEHLNINDVIEFISFDRLDADAVELSGRVNAHIACCAECRARVRNKQCVYDGLLAEGRRQAVKAGATERKPRSRPLEM